MFIFSSWIVHELNFYSNKNHKLIFIFYFSDRVIQQVFMYKINKQIHKFWVQKKFKFKWIHCGLLNLTKIWSLLTLGKVSGSDWFLSLNGSRSFLRLELTLDSKYIFLITLVVVLCILCFWEKKKKNLLE